jgi:heterodisulfide reductase subunit B
MRYSYFPGCSLETVGRSYDVSARLAARKLGVELVELEDWNCCGATAYFHIDEILAHTLCARNLAMSEKAGMDVVAPCSGCYKNMRETNAHLKKDLELRDHINVALKEDGLEFSGEQRVLHLVDMFTEDVGIENIRKSVVNSLKGLRVAPYYGCQILRPKMGRENIEDPEFLEDLISATGAEAVDYPLKTECCGGSLIMTRNPVALKLIKNLLTCAAYERADLIVTTCPLCQVNLECYQKKVNREYGTEFSLPVLYFTQVLGLALGIPEGDLLIGSELSSPAGLLKSPAREA